MKLQWRSFLLGVLIGLLLALTVAALFTTVGRSILGLGVVYLLAIYSAKRGKQAAITKVA